MSDEQGTNRRALGDYLDDRLSPEQREAFETRLEHEPGLRLELESELELREALSEEGPELSPGFYTRARARFEEAGRGEKRWSFRWLSWETAGIAAAAALVTALFVPRLMQQGLPTDLGAVATDGQAVALDEEEGLERAPAEEKSRVATPTAPKATRQKKGDVVVDSPEAIREAPVELADAESDRREAPAAPGKPAAPPRTPTEKGGRSAGRDQNLALPSTESAIGETRRVREARDDDAFRAAAPAPEAAGGAPPADVYAESEEPSAEAEQQPTRVAYGKRASVAKKERAPVVVELPAGLAEREQLRLVERLEEWLALLGTPHGEALGMLDPPAADRRLVLIGARRGLACDKLTVRADDDAYRIEAAGARKDRETAGGCALVLPRDGRAVLIDEPR